MNQSPPTDFNDLPSLRNEFLRRLGRNLWCYQQVEAQLKVLMTVGQGAFPLGGVAAAAAKQQALVRTRTLGQLVGDATASVLAQEGRTVDPPVDWLAWSIRFDAGADFADDLHRRLQALVAERNVVVHHARECWDFDSEAGLAGALVELNAQRDSIEAVHETLRRVLLGVQEATQAMVAYLESGAFARQLDEARLGACLVDAVAQVAKADGWAGLSEAGRSFREQVALLPDAQRRGLPKLSRLLVDSGLFELRDEPTQGGVRTMCRLKSAGRESAGFVVAQGIPFPHPPATQGESISGRPRVQVKDVSEMPPRPKGTPCGG